MKRRTILKSILATPAAVALQAQPPAAKPPAEDSPKVETSVPDANAEPVAKFFNKEQFAALSRLADLFEPATVQLPGAKEAKAAEFLDFLLSQSPVPRQTLYRAGLDRLNAESARRLGKPFATVDAQQGDAVLQPLRRPWTYEDPADPLEHFLREAKADIMEATRNSYEYVAAAGKVRRGASGIGEFWYPLY